MNKLDLISEEELLHIIKNISRKNSFSKENLKQIFISLLGEIKKLNFSWNDIREIEFPQEPKCGVICTPKMVQEFMRKEKKINIPFEDACLCIEWIESSVSDAELNCQDTYDRVIDLMLEFFDKSDCLQSLKKM